MTQLLKTYAGAMALALSCAACSSMGVYSTKPNSTARGSGQTNIQLSGADGKVLLKSIEQGDDVTAMSILQKVSKPISNVDYITLDYAMDAAGEKAEKCPTKIVDLLFSLEASPTLVGLKFDRDQMMACSGFIQRTYSGAKEKKKNLIAQTFIDELPADFAAKADGLKSLATARDTKTRIQMLTQSLHDFDNMGQAFWMIDHDLDSRCQSGDQSACAVKPKYQAFQASVKADLAAKKDLLHKDHLFSDTLASVVYGPILKESYSSDDIKKKAASQVPLVKSL
jgi:hypothetical protein